MIDLSSVTGCVFTDLAGHQVLTLNCAPQILANIIFWALVFSGVVALFFIIFSGLKFLTSQGDPKAVEGARKTLTWAIIGLVLILMSFAILNFIADTTGVACIKWFGFSQCNETGTVDVTRQCTNCVRYTSECGAAGQVVGSGYCPDQTNFPVCCVPK